MKRKFLYALCGISLSLILTGCGGGGGGSVASNPKKQNQEIIGYLIDAPVVNMGYRCGGKDDKTDNRGKFVCPSMPIEFHIGDFIIGRVKNLPPDKKVYIQDLADVNRTILDESKVLSMALFLQSIDEKRDIKDIIYIPNSLSVDLSKSLDKMSIKEVRDLLKSLNIKPLSLDRVKEHLLNSLKEGGYLINISKTNSNSGANLTNYVDETSRYPYIPQGKNLTDAMAIRFLNKASFGASKKSLQHIKDIGVVNWVNEQLNIPLKENQYLIKTIEMAKEAEPTRNPASIEEYLADNDTVFNKRYASFHSPRYMESAWFDIAIRSKDQLRQKVAYALSQIIVESDFEPIFTRRGEALSRYFDILAKNALGSYKQLLTDISFNSGMALFLTYNGSKALHTNSAGVKVYPDENYAREIMQLFSIGLNELNIDGTPRKDANGNLIPTYTQTDVNELARVFTGWDLKRNNRFGLVGFTRGDFTHPIEFTSTYHDFGEKKVLGKTIPAGLTGEADIKAAIDIIMSNPNVAPFISKNLIMRLTKSNPSPAYVARVATVFNNTNGNLKEVVKAILLDEEIWDDIKNLRSVKFKEPLIAYTSLLRMLNIKPLPYWYFCGYGAPADDNASNCTRVHNKFLFNNPTDYLGQGAGRAPTVFNFYDNSFIPNDSEFKSSQETAPEVQIQNDTMLIKFSNQIKVVFNWEEVRMTHRGERSIEQILADAPKNGDIPLYYVGADKFYFNLQEDYDFLEQRIDGDMDGDFEELKDNYQKGNIAKINQAVKEYIDFVDNKLTGGLLSKEEKEVIYQELTNDEQGFYNHWAGDDSAIAKIRQIKDKIIRPLYRIIVTSDKYMTE